MSKAKESPEAIVNRFFWTEPLEAAQRALSNGRLAIRHREEEIKNAPKPKPAAIAAAAAAAAAAVVKKSHHKKKAKPGPKAKLKAVEPNSLFPEDGSQTPPPAPLQEAN